MTTIRTADPDDLDAVQGVFRRASLSNAGDRDVLLAHPEALVFARSPLAEGRTRVAVTADDVIGFATLLTARGVAELEDLFVDPPWMRRGVATRLIEDALVVARGLGAAAVEVTANEHAMAFYSSVGFVRFGEATTAFGAAPRLRLAL
jgi:GNAT superfamily N-acetyltransferase